MSVATINPIDHYVAAFQRWERELSRQPGAFLTPLRLAAFSRFTELGFPAVDDEEWRYTNVAAIRRRTFDAIAPSSAGLSRAALSPFVASDDEIRLVLVNGRFSRDLSVLNDLPKGVTVASLSEALTDSATLVEPHLARYVEFDQRPFAALNTAFFHDGAFVHISRGVRLEKPIHVLHVTTPAADGAMLSPRVLIVAEENSEACVIESYAGAGESVHLTNAVTELIAGDNAVLAHHKVQREPLGAYHVGLLRLQTGRDTNLTSHSIAFGGAIARNDIHAVMNGSGGDCHMNGLFVGAGSQHIDHHLRVEHAKPHCDSREYFKGILDGQAHGVFTGRIVVHKDAQKTDAKQTNMNLLLSEEAQIDTKPQLEIFADDVKCTHGATIGQIDSDAMFYLRSRGVPESRARSLMVFAFASESLAEIKNEPLRAQLRRLLLERLPDSAGLEEVI